MKKLLFLATATLLTAGIISCEKPENGYKGTNYINLSSASSMMYAAENEKIEVDILLTTALKEDLTLKFEIQGEDGGLVQLQGNPVTIKAGELRSSVSIESTGTDASLVEIKNLSLTLSQNTVLPEKVRLAKDFSFTVHPGTEKPLTAAQEKIVAAYKAKTGIDLKKYLGLIEVTAEYNGYNVLTYEEESETFTGKTIITLSEQSTEAVPVLKMTTNPMGMQDKMYQILRDKTVNNADTWLYDYGDGTKTSYMILMETLKWNANTQEHFAASLDGIKLNGTTVEYIGKGADVYGDETDVVPFEFSFSAYDRELEEIAAGNLVKDDEWLYDATAEPRFHLNCNNIILTPEEVEDNEEELYTETTAAISSESLVFTFCFSGNNEYLNRVTATYKPVK